MNYYRNPIPQSDSKTFSSNQIRALSNGIGIGATRQRRATSHPAQQEQISIHQTEYSRVIKEQSVSHRQKGSLLYSLNRYFAAFAIDVLMLSSILGVGAFVAFLALDGVHEFSFDSMRLSAQNFTTVATTLTSNLKLAEIILIPSTILLVYYLGLTLLLGNTVGFSFFKKKPKKGPSWSEF